VQWRQRTGQGRVRPGGWGEIGLQEWFDSEMTLWRWRGRQDANPMRCGRDSFRLTIVGGRICASWWQIGDGDKKDGDGERWKGRGWIDLTCDLI